jgi:predicted NBD/HSP70 family sugar kinase
MPRPTLAVADRRAQRAAVVGALHDGRMSRSQLVERFGVSGALITRVVRGLLDDGLVRELGVQTPSVGRPPMQLELSRGYGALIAVSCTADGVQIRSSDLHRKPLRELASPDGAAPTSPEALVDLIGAVIARTPSLMGIGVAVPGVVDADTGDVSEAPDLGWSGTVPLRTMLAERFRVPVTIDNDVNLMVTAERQTLPDPIRRNAVYLYLGARGIGAGLVAGDRLVRGSHGGAGEIGLIPLGLGGAELSDFEDNVSTMAIAARLDAAGHHITGPVIPALLDLADAGDEFAIAVRRDIIAAFAHAVTLMTAILDPAAVLLGGHARSFRESERAEIAASLGSHLPFRPEVMFAQHGPAAVLDAARDRCWRNVLAGGL